MTTQNNLFLHEEIMLLALRDEEGTIASGTMYQYAIGAAVLAELLLNQRIVVDKSGKRKLVDLVSSTPLGEPLLDHCLEKVTTAKRRAVLQTWVSRFAGVKNLKHLVAQRLCRRGILRVDEDKVLLIFTRKIYPEVNPEPERKLIERLREAIFTDAPDVDSRTVVLVSLANSASLLNVVFGKKMLKARKARIERIVNGEITGKAAQEAIQAMQAAVMVACIMPVMMSTMHH
ncbi:MAG: GPP34 family phosphoprotein [Planctomycetes bacterium]|nr:GPP34 family phosphoprotein [Planctomycetota bacterium]MBL7187585.1 GPP34 family phosphoprotein [Phycisphaerae bacterium]